MPGPTKGLARTFKDDVTSFPALLSSRDVGCDDEAPAEDSLFEAMLGLDGELLGSLSISPRSPVEVPSEA